MTPVLQVRGVTKAYGEVPVLRGIDLSVDEHRAIALIGASGSGKSTLLRCSFAREVADDGCFLHDGLIVERGAPEAVLGTPRRPETQRFLSRLGV